MIDTISDQRFYTPFQPRKPVDPSLFVGRKAQIERIDELLLGGENEVRAIYIEGDPGIGKTSLSRYCRRKFELEWRVLDKPSVEVYPIRLSSLEEPISLKDLISYTIQEVIDERTSRSGLRGRFKQLVQHYVEEINIRGVKLKPKCLPRDEKGFLSFIRSLIEPGQDEDKRIVLIFDEIDAVAQQPFFGDFFKSLIDSNSVASRRVSLLIMVCGTHRRFKVIAENNRRNASVIDLIPIDPLNDSEVKEFFGRAFTKIGFYLTDDASDILVPFSHGLPHLMHLVGENTRILCRAGRKITKREACRGVVAASEEIGRKFFDYKIAALTENKGFSVLLNELKNNPLEWEFTRGELLNRVGLGHKKTVDRFLQRLKQLEIIESHHIKGRWAFADRLTALYVQKQIGRFLEKRNVNDVNHA